MQSDIENGLYIGIDGGGSKCKAVVMSHDNEILGSGISGPGNPLHGFKQATDSIIESALLALKDANLSHIGLADIPAGIGLAGVNLPIVYEQMSVWKHPFKNMHLATDLLIACLGAHQSEQGAIIITGTGSCGFSMVEGEKFIIGGHGFPQGDKGSGAWFGLQAVQQVLLSLDGIVAHTLMSDVLLNKLDCKNTTEIVQVIAGKSATFYAQLAVVVCDAADEGDKIALEIMKEGASYIDDIARALWRKKPARMSMIGGLSVRFIPWLDNEIQQKLSLPISQPEVGAVLFLKSELAV